MYISMHAFAQGAEGRCSVPPNHTVALLHCEPPREQPVLKRNKTVKLKRRPSKSIVALYRAGIKMNHTPPETL